MSRCRPPLSPSVVAWGLVGLLAASTAQAAPSEAERPGWSDLTPWRTWVVLEDVAAPIHWFVHDPVADDGEWCEIGIPVDFKGEEPMVWCGEPAHGDAGRSPSPRRLRKERKRAIEALAPRLGLPPERIEAGGVDHLGTFRRVSFRQLVVTEADPDPAEARAMSVIESWDVDVDTGVVVRPPMLPQFRDGPLCMEGFNPDCDGKPRLVDYAPAEGWDGMLVDRRWGTDLAPRLEQLGAHVRSAALSVHETGAWSPAMGRSTGGTVLPEDFDAGVLVVLKVRVVPPGQVGEMQLLPIDLPLNKAAFGEVSVTVPFEEVDASLVVEADLSEGYVDLTLSDDAGEPIAARYAVSCRFVQDGDRAALRDGCDVTSAAPWMSLRDETGADRLQVRLVGPLKPLTIPTAGPGPR